MARPTNEQRERRRQERLAAVVERGGLEAAGAALAILRDESASASVRLQAAQLLAGLAERGVTPAATSTTTPPAESAESVRLLREVLAKLEEHGHRRPGLLLLDPRPDEPHPLPPPNVREAEQPAAEPVPPPEPPSEQSAPERVRRALECGRRPGAELIAELTTREVAGLEREFRTVLVPRGARTIANALPNERSGLSPPGSRPRDPWDY